MTALIFILTGAAVLILMALVLMTDDRDPLNLKGSSAKPNTRNSSQA